MALILVVDDEISVREMIRDMIEMDGHEVILAADGEQAIELCIEKNVELVITDLVMPKKTGVDFIMEIKKINPAIPVIAISGGGGITGNTDYLPIAKLVGAVAVLNKPFDMNELRSLVSETLAK